MQIELLAETRLELEPRAHWIFFSESGNCFVVGDGKTAFSVEPGDPGRAKALIPGASSSETLPIPDAAYDEFIGHRWRGFELLDRTKTSANPAGALAATLGFGPSYGLYLRHPASRLILSLRSGSMRLLNDSAGVFTEVDKIKTRGRAALAFAAHPSEMLIAYGDNAGVFYGHRFDASGFGKASKLADKQRNANCVEFVDNGKMLVVAGTGYLSTFAFDGSKISPAHDVSISARDFLWLDDGAMVIVNQGLHGIAVYRYATDGFSKVGEIKPTFAVEKVAVSSCRKFLAATSQDAAGISVYRIDNQ